MQQQIVRFLLAFVVLVVLLGAGAIAYVVATGLDARKQPSALEARIARSVRRLAVPRDIRERRNPVQPSADVMTGGIDHFADHCASCHGVDGSGDTEIGRGLFPKAPDMFARASYLSLRQFDRFGTSSLITRTTNDTTQVQQMVIMMLTMVITAPMMAIGGVILALSQDAELAWVLIAVMPVMALVFGLIMK